MKTSDENNQNPTSRERGKSYSYRRTQEASSILLLLIFLTLVFAISTTCGAEETKASKTKPYPDKWYQAFPGKERISNICFSDKDIWGDEPVVFLDEDRANNGTPKYLTHRTTMVGFFSGKRKKIYSTCKFVTSGCGDSGTADGCYSCSGIKYVGTKRAVKRCEYIPPQTESSIVETADGGKLDDDKIAIWERGEIIGELLDADIHKKLIEYRAGNKDMTSEQRKEIKRMEEAWTSRFIDAEIDAVSVIFAPCEPVKEYLVKKDKGGNIVWAKFLVRYYPDRSKALGPEYPDQCASVGNIKARIISQANPKLVLADGTILVGAPGAVVRIRQEDGSTKKISDRNMKVFDAVEVITAKLEITKKQVALKNKCRQEGKKASSRGCDYFGVGWDSKSNERIELELAKKLFNIK